MTHERTPGQLIRHLLSQVTHVPQSEISSQLKLRMLGIDSAGAISLAAFIEEEFGVCIDAEELVGDVTVGELIASVDFKHSNGTARKS